MYLRLLQVSNNLLSVGAMQSLSLWSSLLVKPSAPPAELLLLLPIILITSAVEMEFPWSSKLVQGRGRVC